MSLVRARQQEPLDALVWRKLGRGAGAVETVLLLNPGLDRVTFLAEGTRVRLPDAPPPPLRQLINLWS
jgi:phage tail protein X